MLSQGDESGVLSLVGPQNRAQHETHYQNDSAVPDQDTLRSAHIKTIRGLWHGCRRFPSKGTLIFEQPRRWLVHFNHHIAEPVVDELLGQAGRFRERILGATNAVAKVGGERNWRKAKHRSSSLDTGSPSDRVACTIKCSVCRHD